MVQAEETPEGTARGEPSAHDLARAETEQFVIGALASKAE